MSEKNFMSYGDAETILSGFSEKIKEVEESIPAPTPAPDLSAYETSWTGTQDEWDALDDEEKAKYQIVNITDDDTSSQESTKIYNLLDLVSKGKMRFVDGISFDTETVKTEVHRLMRFGNVFELFCRMKFDQDIFADKDAIATDTVIAEIDEDAIDASDLYLYAVNSFAGGYIYNPKTGGSEGVSIGNKATCSISFSHNLEEKIISIKATFMPTPIIDGRTITTVVGRWMLCRVTGIAYRR